MQITYCRFGDMDVVTALHELYPQRVATLFLLHHGGHGPAVCNVRIRTPTGRMMMNINVPAIFADVLPNLRFLACDGDDAEHPRRNAVVKVRCRSSSTLTAPHPLDGIPVVVRCGTDAVLAGQPPWPTVRVLPRLGPESK